mmetsp:Transcript_15327/g.33122  ORF Transcript_15327/g.33122 Transcript_15327/m.33122 type:complete len:361 (+) Transcript_15327:187-1269(+)
MMSSTTVHMMDDDHHHDANSSSTPASPSIQQNELYDCIQAMLRQEQHYTCHDYLQFNHKYEEPLQQEPASTSRSDPIDENCRSKMAEWCFHVVDCTNLQRNTVSIAMRYLDRFLCTSSHRAERARFDRKEYQLAAMTTLYIAVKLHEPLEMDATLVARLSRGLHTASEVTTLERDMLIALSWRVSAPSPYDFTNYILKLLPKAFEGVAPSLNDFSHFQCELATGDYAYVPLRTSFVAIAAVLNSLEGITQDDFPFKERMQFIQVIGDVVDFDIFSPVINAVRMRLLESFSKSSGFDLPQAGLIPVLASKQPSVPTSSSNTQIACTEINESLSYQHEKSSEYGESPACVSKELAFSMGVGS